MTDKERLGNLNPTIVDNQGNVTLKGEDFHWLMEQDEQVQELEQQNKRYREALKFYADRENYKPNPNHYDLDIDEYISTIDSDNGATARKALEGEE